MLPPTVHEQAAEPDLGSGPLWHRPRWFTTLFLTDLWERFSFYGMMGILYLFAVAPRDTGGLAQSPATATAVVGAYLSVVFLASVPGGWLGDRVLGTRRATLYGAVLIMLGHTTMAFPARWPVFAGMALIAAGTGLLKPNLAALLGGMYPRSARGPRDAAFALFYMSIQVSAIAGPLVTGLLGEKIDWHLGFAAAAVGMLFGILQYVRGAVHFGDVGLRPERPATSAELRRVLVLGGTGGAVLLLGFGADALAGTFRIGHVLAVTGLLSVVAPIIAFTLLLRHRAIRTVDRVRVGAYVWVFLSSAVFWMLYVQTGTVLAGFADVSTDRGVAGFTVPASWFQSVVPFFVLVFAPVAARFWLRAGDRASGPVKLSLGLACVGLSMVVMAAAAAAAAGGVRVSPLWLVAALAVHAVGEVTFAPVGISMTTGAAPPAFMSQMVALFWLSAALGAGVGGHAVDLSGGDSPAPGFFLALGLPAFLAAAALLAFARPLKRRLQAGSTSHRAFTAPRSRL
ncbi:peptide MFS transporter [Actinoplanes sp. CA-051413]|uniref:peptide MFS transporter n=1 Tax=Actinoplanes sp. CA-051413 TaxID=3239899 RepID=UPI003D97A151